MATSSLPQLKRALEDLRKALEVVESTLLEFEEELGEEATVVRPQAPRGMDLLSLPEVCQILRMGKSWVYRRVQSGEIPSMKLGRNIKVKRQDLEEYLAAQYQPSSPST